LSITEFGNSNEQFDGSAARAGGALWVGVGVGVADAAELALPLVADEADPLDCGALLVWLHAARVTVSRPPITQEMRTGQP
jgi:hypothetical protein